jgi:hypothetical protein
MSSPRSGERSYGKPDLCFLHALASVATCLESDLENVPKLAQSLVESA